MLHIDFNNFFASVECLYRPELKKVPMAVAGDPEKRHGIILAKNELAKKYGVKTGEAIWQAKVKCPSLSLVLPQYGRYAEFSEAAVKIYSGYTDRIEPFGPDECWLDTTQSTSLFGDGEKIANELREYMKRNLGLTVSAGVSFNKTLAKLGSDMKKPDATTVLTKDNFRDRTWGLPVSDLLFAGPKTTAKLKSKGIFTIGGLAATPPEILRSILGINGIALWQCANGIDNSEVEYSGSVRAIKSIGNSTTLPYDITEEWQVRRVLCMLCDCVSARLRKHSLCARAVQVSFRDSLLRVTERQCSLSFDTCGWYELFRAAFELYKTGVSCGTPLRSLGVRAISLCEKAPAQLYFYSDTVTAQRWEDAEQSIDIIKSRYGEDAVFRASQLCGDGLFTRKTEEQGCPFSSR